MGSAARKITKNQTAGTVKRQWHAQVHNPAFSDPQHGIMGLQDIAGNHAVNQALDSENANQPDTIQEHRDNSELKPLPSASATVADAKGLPSAVSSVLTGGGGRPLEPGIRSFMESRFGYDFSPVRVHTGASAADSARKVNAAAYTVGKDVVFGEGRYAPGTLVGKQLMAHELTHTVQQRPGGNEVPIAGPESVSERAADNAAHSVVSGGAVGNTGTTSVGVAPQLEGESMQLQLKPFVPRGITPTPLNVIQYQLTRRFSIENVAERQKAYILAFNLLEQDDARVVHNFLHHPKTKEQKQLKNRFQRLRTDLREGLTGILSNKLGGITGQEKTQRTDRVQMPKSQIINDEQVVLEKDTVTSIETIKRELLTRFKEASDEYEKAFGQIDEVTHRLAKQAIKHLDGGDYKVLISSFLSARARGFLKQWAFILREKKHRKSGNYLLLFIETIRSELSNKSADFFVKVLTKEGINIKAIAFEWQIQRGHNLEPKEATLVWKKEELEQLKNNLNPDGRVQIFSGGFQTEGFVKIGQKIGQRKIINIRDSYIWFELKGFLYRQHKYAFSEQVSGIGSVDKDIWDKTKGTAYAYAWLTKKIGQTLSLAKGGPLGFAGEALARAGDQGIRELEAIDEALDEGRDVAAALEEVGKRPPIDLTSPEGRRHALEQISYRGMRPGIGTNSKARIPSSPKAKMKSGMPAVSKGKGLNRAKTSGKTVPPIELEPTTFRPSTTPPKVKMTSGGTPTVSKGKALNSAKRSGKTAQPTELEPTIFRPSKNKVQPPKTQGRVINARKHFPKNVSRPKKRILNPHIGGKPPTKPDSSPSPEAQAQQQQVAVGGARSQGFLPPDKPPGLEIFAGGKAGTGKSRLNQPGSRRTEDVTSGPPGTTKKPKQEKDLPSRGVNGGQTPKSNQSRPEVQAKKPTVPNQNRPVVSKLSDVDMSDLTDSKLAEYKARYPAYLKEEQIRYEKGLRRSPPISNEENYIRLRHGFDTKQFDPKQIGQSSRLGNLSDIGVIEQETGHVLEQVVNGHLPKGSANPNTNSFPTGEKNVAPDHLPPGKKTVFLNETGQTAKNGKKFSAQFVGDSKYLADKVPNTEQTRGFIKLARYSDERTMVFYVRWQERFPNSSTLTQSSKYGGYELPVRPWNKNVIAPGLRKLAKEKKVKIRVISNPMWR